MNISNKIKILSSIIVGVLGGSAIMVIGGNKGLATPFVYPRETLIFSGFIFFLSITVLYFKFLWARYRNLSSFFQIITLYPISLCVVLIREFIDSGFRFYIRELFTVYDSIYVFVVLLAGLWLLRNDLDKLEIAFQWRSFIKKIFLFVLLAGILFIIHLAILFTFTDLCYMC